MYIFEIKCLQKKKKYRLRARSKKRLILNTHGAYKLFEHFYKKNSSIKEIVITSLRSKLPKPTCACYRDNKRFFFYLIVFSLRLFKDCIFCIVFFPQRSGYKFSFFILLYVLVTSTNSLHRNIIYVLLRWKYKLSQWKIMPLFLLK